MASMVREDNSEMIQLLLARGADLSRRDAVSSGNALAHTCVFGHVPDIEAMLHAAPHLLDDGDAFGAKPFAMLTQFGHARALAHLIERSPKGFAAETMTGNPCGWVSWAVMMVGDLDTVRVLLERGFDLAHYDPTTVGSKMFARILALSRLVVRVSRRPSGLFESVVVGYGTALHLAAYRGNYGAVQLLLHSGADPASIRHPLGMTPLHAAAVVGRRDVCEALLSAGAPNAARDGRGRTAADWARRRGHVDLAHYLSAPGARSVAEPQGATNRGSGGGADGGVDHYTMGSPPRGAGRKRSSLSQLSDPFTASSVIFARISTRRRESGLTGGSAHLSSGESGVKF